MPRLQRFENRQEAGKALAEALKRRIEEHDVLVLGLPRGGVPVAAEVAQALNAPLDVLNVRKLGVPGQPEVAMGAIAEGGTRVLNESLIRALDISPRDIDRISALEQTTLEERAARFRGNRPEPEISGRIVVLIDDGLATGATMEVAIKVLRAQGAGRIIVAVPVGPAGTAARFSTQADDCVCLLEPSNFQAVGQWYERFTQVSSDEVCRLLAEANGR